MQKINDQKKERISEEFEKFKNLKSADLIYACIADIGQYTLVTCDSDFDIYQDKIDLKKLNSTSLNTENIDSKKDAIKYIERGIIFISSGIDVLEHKKARAITSSIFLTQLGIELVFKGFLFFNNYSEKRVKNFKHNIIKLYQECCLIDNDLRNQDYEWRINFIIKKSGFGDFTKVRYSFSKEMNIFDLDFAKDMKKLANIIKNKVKLN